MNRLYGFEIIFYGLTVILVLVVVVVVVTSPGTAVPARPIAVVVASLSVTLHGRVFAHQAPDGENRLGGSAAAGTGTAAPAAVSVVVGVASGARTGPRAQVHDYGGTVVTSFRSDHHGGGGDDAADGIYRDGSSIPDEKDHRVVGVGIAKKRFPRL